MVHRIVQIVAACAAFVFSAAAALAAPEDDPHYQPVKALADRGFAIWGAQARYYGTVSLDGDARVERVFVNIHGLLRNADVYEKTGERFLAAGSDAASAVITPQFLTQIDVDGWKLSPATLRWDIQSWLDGTPSNDPAHLSAFDVLDAIVGRLADRSAFPRLRETVIIGHSGGGQLVQRYAVVAKAPAIEGTGGLRLRFIVANPSSYVYFDQTRPEPAIAANCPGFNAWKYGPQSPPPYVDPPIASMETRYLRRNVTYLLGQRDIDPQHPVLDRTCMAEAQGPYRLLRGRNYVAYLRLRHPGGTNRQAIAEVGGIGHDADALFTSACGVAVLFDRDRRACAVNANL